MNEENKNHKPEEKKPEGESATQAAKSPPEKQMPKSAEPQKPPEPSQVAKPVPGKGKVKPEKAPEKKARPQECAACNKSIKNRWYYREGNYYCNKRCWKKSKKTEEKK